uniref:Uncharacterized protein n=1 Tax=Glossina brevipalpis TaxID=37001 RepID=A0A1A9W1B7_9MUSC
MNLSQLERERRPDINVETECSRRRYLEWSIRKPQELSTFHQILILLDIRLDLDEKKIHQFNMTVVIDIYCTVLMNRKRERAALGERYLSFDRQEIRKRILMPTFAAARRRKGSIYNTLIKELYEGYCPTTAGFFEEIIIKEQQLLEKQAIRQRLCDEPYLLFSLYDHCKLAEQAIRLDDGVKGQTVCVRLLFQCMLFCEKFDKMFNWLNEDIYEAVTKICNNLTERQTIKQTLCKMNLKYARILTQKDIPKAVNYLNNAFDLSKGTNWLTRVTDKITKPTTNVIGELLVETLLKCAYLEDTTKEAVCRAEESLLVVHECGQLNDDLLVITVNLVLANFLIEDSKFDKCLKVLACIEEKLTIYAPNYQPYRREYCRFLSLKARYLNRTEQKDIALDLYNKTIILAEELDMKSIWSQCLMEMARIYLEHRTPQLNLAERCLMQSRGILIELNDVKNLKICNYDLARVKSRMVFGHYMETIKDSSTSRCELHRLLEWKTRCKPFWLNKDKAWQSEEKNPIACLLLPQSIERLKLEAKVAATTRLKDYITTKLQDCMTTQPQNCKATRLQGSTATKLQDHEIIRLRNYEAARLHNCKTTLYYKTTKL